MKWKEIGAGIVLGGVAGVMTGIVATLGDGSTLTATSPYLPVTLWLMLGESFLGGFASYMYQREKRIQADNEAYKGLQQLKVSAVHE